MRYWNIYNRLIPGVCWFYIA